MDRKCCVPLQLKREIGLFVHSSSASNELAKIAEDKAAVRESQEINCSLPGNPRSTFLMVFSPDGTKVASTHGDHHIYVTDIKTGKCLHTLDGHPRTPWCIAFHPSSNEILASGCLGGEVRVWDLHGGSEVWKTYQNTVIASLAFHPFDQVLVIATVNEIYFWDWNQPKPFASCKTATEREKVRYVKFDLLGHKLLTGIANQPVVQSVRSDASRARYASLMEHYHRILDVRRGQQQQQTPATQNTGTDPIATNERPTSPTQAQALQSAREYAQEVTTDNLQFNRLSEETNSNSTDDFNRDSWRFRDPMRLRESTSNISANATSSSHPESRNRDSNASNSLDTAMTETTLPSSLIQALIRLQRSLDVLTQTRINTTSERNSSEQAHLRQRIEEILNRLFNLYASITPLRILMDEVFQDVDRDALLAEVNRDNVGSIAGQSGLDSQLQELRQQLARLLDRILRPEAERNISNEVNISLPSTSTSSSTLENQASLSTHTSRYNVTSRFAQPIVWEQPLLVNYPRSTQTVRRHSNNEQGTSETTVSADNGTSGNLQPTAPDASEMQPSQPSTQPSIQTTIAPSVWSLSHHRHPSNSMSTSSSSHNHDQSTDGNSVGNRNWLRYARSHLRSANASFRPYTSEIQSQIPATTVSNEARRAMQIPRVQIDPAEPNSTEDDADSRPRVRPRSPPLSSMVNIDQATGRQLFADYQAATSSNSVPGSRVPSGSLFLHPNYVASLFEESLQRTNALQLVINRALAGTGILGTAEFAVVNNVMSLTHRIQWWDFSRLRIPDISDCRANIVVAECKIHNDASVDIAADSSLLAVLVPGSVGLPSTTIVSLYSLEKRNMGTCLYSYYFGPNAISVSLSPLSRYIVVGLASRRVTVAPSDKQVVAQVFKLTFTKDSTHGNLDLVRNIEQHGSNRLHVSLNSIRWLPLPGQGIVYGTNRGELKICRPGPSKEDEYLYARNRRSAQTLIFSHLRSVQGHSVQSTSTQTVSPQTQSAGTQTGIDLEGHSEVVASTSAAALAAAAASAQ